MAELSVIFVDVRGFTAISQRLPPTQMVDKLNRFYKLASQTVFDLERHPRQNGWRPGDGLLRRPLPGP